MPSSPTTLTIPTERLQLLHIKDYKDMITEEAEKLYHKLLKYFTSSIVDNACFYHVITIIGIYLPSQSNGSMSTEKKIQNFIIK